MMRRWLVFLSVLPAGLLTVFSFQQPLPVADLILHNAFIWTGNRAQPRAQAVAIQGNRIVSVGSDQEVLRARGSETQVVDLKGRFMVPGFSDNHTHFSSAARFLEFNIMTVSTQEEFLQRVQQVIQTLQKGEWITGGFWGAYQRWARGSAGGKSGRAFQPEVSRIESLTADFPLFIEKFDRSEFAVNQAALRAVGLNPEEPQVDGVEFLRGPDGRPNGIVKGDKAYGFFSSRIPDLSRSRRVRQTEHALAEIRRFGVTNISDMSDDLQLEIFRELHRQGKLTVRVHFRHPLERWPELAKQGIRIGSGDAWIRLGGLKGHIDGIMGNSTARFFKPYRNQEDNRGRWRHLLIDEDGEYNLDLFYRHMKGADEAGLQLSVHAIGDEANHVLLNLLERLENERGTKDRRFRLVHAQVLAQEDFKRLGKLGVIAEVQPFHLSDDMRWMEERIGRERCRGAYAFASLQDSGAMLSFGSDWPGTAAAEYPINPMLALYAAVTRQTATGEPDRGWFPEQKVSVEEALRAYTFASSYANFEEDLKGSVQTGKLADLVVLSENLLEVEPKAFLETQVLYTIVDGEIVYRSE